MKIYEYLYYKLYCIWQMKKSESEIAYINAIISISFLLCFNILSVPLGLMAILGKDIIIFPKLPDRWVLFIIVIAFGVSQYFLFAHKKRYREIIKRYENETNKMRRIGFIFTWLYILISIGIPIYIFFFTTPK